MRFFIGELEVLFPYDFIYPEQIKYMTALKSSLGKGHSVLEMPTGTGKTITLLSLLLAYQYRYPQVGKLIYCTRTVHEMTKVMSELKNLSDFRERLIHQDQEDFVREHPEVAKMTIELLNMVEQDSEAKQEETNGESDSSTSGVGKNHVSLKMEDEDEIPTTTTTTTTNSNTNPSNENSTHETMTPGTIRFEETGNPIDGVVMALVEKGVAKNLAEKAVRIMRDPSILGVCMSSRRNMCIHPVVSKFDQKERVDSLCRGMTAGFVRDKVLTVLASSTNAATSTTASTAPDTYDEDMTDAPPLENPCGDCPNSSSSPQIPIDPANPRSIRDHSSVLLADIEDVGSVGLCGFYEGLQSTGNVRLKGVYDLDRLKEVGLEKNWCPYYLTRKSVQFADVIVLNYHYMLDPKTSSVINNFLPSNSVVVFDEAHNIDNICIEAMSISLNKNDIHSASRSLNKLKQLVEKCEKDNQQRLQDEYQKLVQEILVNNLGEEDPEIMEIAGNPIDMSLIRQQTVPGSIRRARHFLVLLKTVVEYMKLVISDTVVTQQSPLIFMEKYKTETGINDTDALKFCYDRLALLLRTLEINDVDDFTSLLKMCSFATLIAHYANIKDGNTQLGGMNIGVPGLMSQYIPGRAGLNNPAHAIAGNNDSFVVLFEPFDPNNLPDARLQLVCVDATIAMAPVAEKFASVIITSGTLTPLDMLPKMLGLNPIVSESFNMSLSRQVIMPLVVTKGNDQNPLSSSFAYRETSTMSLSYGHLLVSLAKSVPDGILVFFPSYTYMEHTMQKWAELGIITQLLKYKLIFLETKDIEETTLALTSYRKACSSGRGGIFFSIARGKVSEGIDFSGHLGRAVVLIGVPYQYVRSRQLLARLDYLREHMQIPESEYLHFDAMRQCAQCIGRIIRSKNDYGVVLLADQRYSRNDLKNKLPKWVNYYLLPEHTSLSSESAVYATRKFFKTTCDRGDVMSEAGVRGTILLDGSEANSFVLKLKGQDSVMNDVEE